MNTVNLSELTKADTSFANTTMIGKVVDNVDTSKRGRIQVFVPQLHKNEQEVELPWAYPISAMFGGGKGAKDSPSTSNWGFHMVPQIGDMVVLIPLLADVNTLCYLGSIPSIHQTLPEVVSEKTFVMRFPNGHKLIFETDAASAHVTLETSKGYKMQIDDSTNTTTITIGNSTITMDSAGNINIVGSAGIVVQGNTINLN